MAISGSNASRLKNLSQNFACFERVNFPEIRVASPRFVSLTTKGKTGHTEIEAPVLSSSKVSSLIHLKSN